jgi:4-amino-4-deoxy-L-arabinose transferase-like glycosyltransferase
MLNREPFPLAAILFGIVLTAFGLVLLRGDSLAGGAAALVLALSLFVMGFSRLQSTPLTDDDLAELVRTWSPTFLLYLGFGLSFLAAFQAGRPATVDANTLAVVLWAASLACLVLGSLWLEHWNPSPRAFLARIWRHKLEILLVLSIFVIGLGARTYLLDQHPYAWSGDEATVGMEGRRILTDEWTQLFSSGWSGNPTLAFYPSALAVAIFGSTILAVRFVAALVGALTVLTIYLLARLIFDRTTAMLAAAFLTTYPVHLQFSRIGVLNVFDGLTVTLSLWLVIRAARQERLSAYVLAGIVSGLAFYTYVGSRLVIGLSLALLAYLCIRERGFFKAHVRHLLLYVASAWSTLAPMASFYSKHQDLFMDRFNQAGILLNGWLAREGSLPGKSVASVLLDQFVNSTLVFVSQPAVGGFFNAPRPYLTFAASLFFLLGMAYAFRHILKPHFMILLLWFWSVVIFGGVLTLDPPANTRFVMTAPAVALFLAIGVTKVMEILGYLRLPSGWRLTFGIVVVALLAVQNATFYFGAYRSGYYFEDANAEVAAQAGLELRRLGPKYTLYMMGRPRMFSDFPTIQYLAPLSPREDLDPALVSAADLSRGLPAFVVAIPDNLTALESLRSRYPGGTWEAVPSRALPEVLYYAYSLPAPAAPPSP